MSIKNFEIIEKIEKGLLEKAKQYSPAVLRIALAFVFLWFGINQLINPQDFIGYIPQFILAFLKEKVIIAIIINGIFETIFATALLLGLLTRVSALLLSLHLFGIVISLGYNEIAVRDLGLAIATIVVFLNGADTFCLQNKFFKKEV